eukprot:g17341.t1
MAGVVRLARCRLPPSDRAWCGTTTVSAASAWAPTGNSEWMRRARQLRARQRKPPGVNGTHLNIYRSQDNRTFQTRESEEPLYLYGGDGEINHVCENANLLTSFPRDATSRTRITIGISMTNSSWTFSADPPCTAIAKDQCVGTYGWSKGKIESAWLYIDLKLQAQISVV